MSTFLLIIGGCLIFLFLRHRQMKRNLRKYKPRVQEKVLENILEGAEKIMDDGGNPLLHGEVELHLRRNPEHVISLAYNLHGHPTKLMLIHIPNRRKYIAVPTWKDEETGEPAGFERTFKEGDAFTKRIEAFFKRCSARAEASA